VVETSHALRDAEWLSRNPKARADDLMEAFGDPSVRGIISTIGGDDSIRILRHLDLEVLRDHPKLFVGYSDSTVTHFACLAAGLGSLYGPTIMSGFGENAGMHVYLADSFRRAAFTADAPGLIEPSAAATVESLPGRSPSSKRARARSSLRPAGASTVRAARAVRSSAVASR
jgi:muramoyltetrapeptide carboxypeptidase LdcA involved in peptidoglycan recycling